VEFKKAVDIQRLQLRELPKKQKTEERMMDERGDLWSGKRRAMD
jgi:hypothetical protein